MFEKWRGQNYGLTDVPFLYLHGFWREHFWAIKMPVSLKSVIQATMFLKGFPSAKSRRQRTFSREEEEKGGFGCQWKLWLEKE